MESWKKSYSQLKLLANKVLQNEEKRGLFNSLFFGNQRYLVLNLPYFDFLRGKVYVNDLIELLEDAPHDLTIFDLINALYIDFMHQVKKGLSFKKIAPFLIDSKKKYLLPQVEERRVLKQVRENIFSFEPVREVVQIQREENEMAEITIRMREDSIYRGEIFLNDVSAFMNGEVITFEELLSILYLDFIHRIKENGNSITVMESILDNLDLLDT